MRRLETVNNRHGDRTNTSVILCFTMVNLVYLKKYLLLTIILMN